MTDFPDSFWDRVGLAEQLLRSALHETTKLPTDVTGGELVRLEDVLQSLDEVLCGQRTGFARVQRVKETV